MTEQETVRYRSALFLMAMLVVAAMIVGLAVGRSHRPIEAVYCYNPEVRDEPLDPRSLVVVCDDGRQVYLPTVAKMLNEQNKETRK